MTVKPSPYSNSPAANPAAAVQSKAYRKRKHDARERLVGAGSKECKEDMPLHNLHYAIQRAMGWSGRMNKPENIL